MATYKDDLDIIKAAEKDSSKLSLNAITELDNKGKLGMYGGGGSDLGFDWDFLVRATVVVDTKTNSPRFENIKLLAGDYDTLKAKIAAGPSSDIYSSMIIDTDAVGHVTATTMPFSASGNRIRFTAILVGMDGSQSPFYIDLDPGNVVSITTNK